MSEANCSQPTGSAPTYEELGGHVRRAFVIYEEPGKIPQKKGPFVRDSEVETMLREMKPYHHADTRYTVAEITFDFDLWLTGAEEFLFMRENGCPLPDDEEPNTQVKEPREA